MSLCFRLQTEFNSAICVYDSGTQVKVHQLFKACSSHGLGHKYKRANQNVISTLKVPTLIKHMWYLLTSIGQRHMAKDNRTRKYIPLTVNHGKGGEEKKNSKQIRIKKEF